MVVSDLEINGKMDILPGCWSESCLYCPYTVLNSLTKTYQDDRGIPIDISKVATQSLCNANIAAFLFTANSGTTLTLRNVHFISIRMQLLSIININCGQLIMTNVDFTNCQAAGKTLRGLITAAGPTNPRGYTCGLFNYTNGNVKGSNNGYELIPTMVFAGFAVLDAYTKVIMNNITFSFNNVYIGPRAGPILTALVFIRNFREALLSNLVFTNNIGSIAGAIYINTAITLPTTVDGDLKLTDQPLQHLIIANCTFVNNTASNGGAIAVVFTADQQNIILRNCTFLNNFATSKAIFDVLNTLFTDEITTGINVLVLVNGVNQTVWSPPRYILIESCSFVDNYAPILMSLSNVGNLTVTNSQLRGNGESLSKITYSKYVISNFISNFRQYMKIVPVVQPTICSRLITGNNVYRVQVVNQTFANTYCPSGYSGLYFAGSLGAVNVGGLVFANNTGAGALTLSPQVSISLSNLTFANNSLSDQEASVCLHLDLSVPVNISVSKSVFTENSGTSSVALYVAGAASVTLSELTVTKNYASSSSAGVSYMVPSAIATKFTLTKSHFEGNFASSNGVVYIGGLAGSEGGDSTARLDVAIQACSFTGNTATYTGAAISIVDYLLLTLTSSVFQCQFTDNTCEENGAGLYLAFDSGQITIDSCNFKGNHATEGAALYSSHRAATSTTASLLLVQNCDFTKNSGNSALILDGEGNRPQLQSQKNTFTDGECTAVKVQNGIWNDTNSVYTGNHFSQGAVSYSSLASDSTVRFMRAVHNQAQEYGGVFYITNSASLRCYDCTLVNNTSHKIGGVVYLDQSSYFQGQDSTFSGNFAAQKGSVVFQLFSQVTLTRVVIVDNQAGYYGTIYSSDSNLSISSSTVGNNTAAGITPGFAIMLTALTVTNTTFTSQTASTGAFLFGQDQSTAFISNSTFMNCKALSQGGALYFSASTVTVRSSLFTNCTAAIGAAMAFINVCQVSLVEVLFVQNVADTNGAIVSMTQGALNMTGGMMDKYKGGGISGTSLDYANFIGAVFQNGENGIGGGVLLVAVTSALIENCVFMGNFAYIGGAIFAYLTQAQSTNAIVRNSAFYYNFAGYGGAIASESYSVNFTNNTVIGCQALAMDAKTGTGGALYLVCSYNPYCRLFIDSNRFINNSAAVSGGAVIWKANPPSFTSNLFMGNTAVYGKDIASYAIKLAAVTKDLKQKAYLTAHRDVNYTVAYDIENLGSGFLFDGVIRVALFDHQDQIITSDSASGAEFLIPEESNVTIFGNIKAIATNGVFEFSSFTLSAPTNSSQVLLLSVPSISAQTLTAYDQEVLVDTLALRLTFRPCLIGEYLQNSECHECPAGTYSFDPTVPCAQCPSHATCYGNHTMVPDSGYWRSDPYSPTIFECPYAAACTGSSPPPNLALTGNCDSGYDGNLCATCIAGYSKTGKNYCLPCPRTEVNSVIVATILISGLVLIIVVISIAIMTAGNKSEFGIYVKILMNYIQMVVIAAALDLKWPEFVEAFLSTQDMVGGIADQIFSVDCLLQDVYSGKIVFIKVAITCILPILLLFLSLVFWLIVKVIKRPKLLLEKMTASFVMIIFVLHPSLTKGTFSLFSCREIRPSEFWLIKDLGTQCWTDTHVKYLMMISLPGIALWVMLLPLVCLMYLVRKKRYLSDPKMQMRLSFLYKGYLSDVYYWEFVILYRKILLVCSFVFLGRISIRVQALSVLAVLVTSLLLQIKVHPFLTPSLNLLEVKSILVSTVTIYVGLYYETQRLSKTYVDSPVQITLFAVMLVANAYFVLGWLKAVSLKFLSKLLLKLNIGPKMRIEPLPASNSRSFEKSSRQHSTPANLSRVELVQPSNTSMIPEDGSIAHDPPSNAELSK